MYVIHTFSEVVWLPNGWLVCKINYACHSDVKILNAVLDVIFENAGSDFQSFLAPTASVKIVNELFCPDYIHDRKCEMK